MNRKLLRKPFIIFLIFLLNCFNFSFIKINVEGETTADILNSSDLIVKFYEMGNGDCTFIKYGNTEILIDSGEKAGKLETVKADFQSYITDGVLDYLFVTHGDSDHIGNIKKVLSWFTPTNENEVLKTSAGNKFYINTLIDFDTDFAKELYTTNAYNAYVDQRDNMIDKSTQKNNKNKGIKSYYSVADIWNKELNKETNTVLFKNDDLEIHILYNKYYFESTNESNMLSLCLLIKYGKSKVLFTGDLEEIHTATDKLVYGETNLVEYYKDSQLLSDVTLFKAGHHGSRSSNSKKLIDVIKPKYVMITCDAGRGANNFPRQQSLDNFFTYTSNIYISSEYFPDIDLSNSYYGDVTFEIDKDEKVNVYISNSKYINKETQSIIPLSETDWFINNRELKVQTHVFSSLVDKNTGYVGNCTLVKCGSYDIVIDCGLYANSDSRALTQSNFIEDLKEYIIDDEIDYLIITSPTTECISQVVDIAFGKNDYKKGLINYFEIKSLIDFGDSFDPSQGSLVSLYKAYLELRNQLKESGNTTVMSVREVIEEKNSKIEIFENFTINFLISDFYENTGENKHDSSVGFTIEFFDKHMLFLGNMTSKGEENILSNNKLENIVFYLCSGNGSQLSTSIELLDEIKSYNLYVCSNSIIEYNLCGDILFSNELNCRLLNRLKYDKIFVTMEYSGGQVESLSGDLIFVIESDGEAYIIEEDSKENLMDYVNKNN